MYPIIFKKDECYVISVLHPKKNNRVSAEVQKERKRTVIKEMLDFLNKNPKIKDALSIQSSNYYKDIIAPGGDLIAKEYEEKHFDYLAQMYLYNIYHNSIDMEDKKKRRAIIKETVFEYFYLNVFRKEARKFLLKFSFCIPTVNLEAYARVTNLGA